MCKIASKVSLSQTAIQEIVNIIIIHSLTINHALESVNVILTHQKSAESLLPTTVKALMNTRNIVDELKTVAAKFPVDSLITLFCSGLIREASKPAVNLLSTMFHEFPFKTETLSKVVLVLVTIMANDESAADSLSPALRIIQLRHAEALDLVVEKAVSEEYFDTVQKDRIYELLTSTLSGTRNELLPEGKTTLAVGLEHPERQIRFMAVEKLFMMDTSDKEIASFVLDSICTRLRSDHTEVVRNILSHEKFMEMKPNDDLVACIPILLRRTLKSKTKKDLIRWITIVTESKVVDCSSIIFPLLEFAFQCVQVRSC